MKSLLLALCVCSLAYGQAPTVGLIFNSGNAADGYTLFAPEKNNDIFLINNCGEIINQWTFNDKPGATCYLLENGNLLQAGKDNLEIRDWNNNVIWEYATTANGIKQHHDIEPLPNGNILCIVTDNIDATALTDAGRDPNTIGNNFRMDKILEIEPVGTNGANIVWEWYFFDHLVQDFDVTKDNFGVVTDHPELLNINYDHGNHSDWTHVNGIDYNPDLDQIIISARNMDEIYIIDHSTTTAEAASHTGGNSGKGGDFLWRWGNPIVYGQGTISDQKLFGNHDAKWVNNGYLHEGKISVFSNLTTATHSSVHLLVPEMVGTYNYAMNNNTFLPADYFSSWSDDVMGTPMYSHIKSGAIALPNGGFMICETTGGRFIETNEAGEVVWVYENPSDLTVYSQFDVPPTSGNSVFRAEKYPSDYPGFVGHNLNPFGIIENENSLTNSCYNSNNLTEHVITTLSVVNPASKQLIFSHKLNDSPVHLLGLDGKLIRSWSATSKASFNLNGIKPGMYILRVPSLDFSSRIIIE